jgi:hypothetical protein
MCVFRADQTKIGLMNQRRWLECLARLLVGQALGGQPAQLVVDQRQQLISGLGAARGLQDSGDIAHH